MAKRVLDKVDIRISGDEQIDAMIQSIMDVYNDIYIVVLEYLKNSLDSAIAMRGAPDSAPPHPIDIKVYVDSGKGEARVLDNCSGMDAGAMRSLAGDMFVSGKRGQEGLRGKAGLGAHAFRSFFTDALFRSKRRGGQLLELHLRRGSDCISGIPLIELSGSDDDFPYKSGTLVTLYGLQPTRGKQATLEAKAMHREIERRFQRQLQEKDLSITVVDETPSGAVEMPCEPSGVTFGVRYMKIRP